MFHLFCLAITLSQTQLADLQWRMIGPFRGGRTVAACGVPGKPNLFYIGVNNGGVWKTTDAGRTWTPIFDEQPTGSIGALVVAPSNPNVLYVGCGEGLQRPDLSTGDGMYRSDDAGRTWKHLGLREGQQIPAIAVDPRDANRLFVAVLGHPYGPNTERGIYRSTDGGQTFQRVLYRDENTGAMEVVLDPRNPDIVYGVLWSGRQAPWEVGSSWDGPGSGLFKSLDGGSTWRQLTKGLPPNSGRIGLAIAPSDPSRLYAQVDGAQGGTYRSSDAGETWEQVNNEPRIWGRGSDFAELRVHPKEANTLYVANTSAYRSTDGGKSFTAFKGAPGGDDYHRIWIDPDHPEVMIMGADQGATITVNDGATWSTWYNQPTAQFYHVSTDNRFPYWVYGGQQESGSAAVASRGDYGAITHADWRTVGVEEYGYVAPDPLNPNFVYGGKITRTDLRTGDVQDVSPEALSTGKYRFVRTMPVVFSPVDKRALYFAGNVVFKTRDGGHTWETISPDLTRGSYSIPPNLGIFAALDPEKGQHRGVIYTLAPSFKAADVLWAGTDDGLIHLTRDGGKTWTNVTPDLLTPWSKVSILEAGRFSMDTAYAAINTFRLDDLRPHILRTHDGGMTWKEIVNGIPAGEIVNAVREDPIRPGLLFCGTERAVYVSLDDGENWQPLRLNMPATSIRDLVIHGDDVVVGTHGRSFWILDNITPIRQYEASIFQKAGHLFRPQLATRMRRSRNTDTPMPPEEPMGQNPPDGAILDYWLAGAPKGPVTLEVLDAHGGLVRRYSSSDAPDVVDEKQLAVPTYWIRPSRTLSATPGMHRWIWDGRYPRPGAPGSYPISAIPHDTPREPLGPFAAPGRYVVRLTVDGQAYTQPLTLRMDPRVSTPAGKRAAAHALSMRLYRGALQATTVLEAITERRKGALDPTLGAHLSALAGTAGGRGGRRSSSSAENLNAVRGALLGLMDLIESSDQVPTSQAVDAANDRLAALQRLTARWEELRRAQK